MKRKPIDVVRWVTVSRRGSPELIYRQESQARHMAGLISEHAGVVRVRITEIPPKKAKKRV